MKLLRGLLLTVVGVSGLWSVIGATILPIHIGPPILAGLGMTFFGLINRHAVWTLGGLFFAALSVNITAWHLFDLGGNQEAITSGSLVAAVFFGVVWLWIGSRPYISSPALRRSSRISLAGVFIFTPAAVLLDALSSSTSSHTGLVFFALVLGVSGVLLVLLNVSKGIRIVRTMGRTSDAILYASIGLYLALHVPAMVLQSLPLVAAALTAHAVLCLLAMTLDSAIEVGRAFDSSESLFRVRLWPIVTGAVALGVGHGALLSDLSNDVLRAQTIILGVLALVAIAFAIRELGGPQKPLVLPFGSRDRSLQRLPNALLHGEVKLLGLPVHRTADATFVGIEASPAWSNSSNSKRSIELVAIDAGLETSLDSVTLRLAQEHLPAVLAVVPADEPWLSVPLSSDGEQSNRLAEDGDVDGLVLRVSNATVARALETLRDHGAQLQVPARNEFGCDPEIVADVQEDLGERTSSAALRLGRTSFIAQHRDVHLIVDDSASPRSLSAILGEIDTNGDLGKVTRRSDI